MTNSKFCPFLVGTLDVFSPVSTQGKTYNTMCIVVTSG